MKSQVKYRVMEDLQVVREVADPSGSTANERKKDTKGEIILPHASLI